MKIFYKRVISVKDMFGMYHRVVVLLQMLNFLLEVQWNSSI